MSASSFLVTGIRLPCVARRRNSSRVGECIRWKKLQIPNFKLQESSKSQAPNQERQAVGVCCLEVSFSLGLRFGGGRINVCGLPVFCQGVVEIVNGQIPGSQAGLAERR